MSHMVYFSFFFMLSFFTKDKNTLFMRTSEKTFTFPLFCLLTKKDVYIISTFFHCRNVRLQAWDVFRDIPDDPSGDRNEEFYELWNKIFKVLCIIVIFIFVMGCALISKTTILFVTSQVRQNVTLLCKDYIHPLEPNKTG